MQKEGGQGKGSVGNMLTGEERTDSLKLSSVLYVCTIACVHIPTSYTYTQKNIF